MRKQQGQSTIHIPFLLNFLAYAMLLELESFCNLLLPLLHDARTIACAA
jgi:hypothetical protein